MSWADPQALWLLALLPLAAGLLWWNAARRQRATEMFGRRKTLGSLIVGRAQWWRLTRALLPGTERRTPGRKEVVIVIRPSPRSSPIASAAFFTRFRKT